AWVAELDFPLAPAVGDALARAVRRSDTGYASTRELANAFASFAAEPWRWQLEAARTPRVPSCRPRVAEFLPTLTPAGDQAIVIPPAYPPFFTVTLEVGREVVEA